MKVVGSGSIVQRDKSRPRSRCRDWELSVLVEDGGRRKRKTRAVHGTYTAAQDTLHTFLDELHAMQPTHDMPFRDWCGLWHRQRVESLALSDVTLAGDAQRVNAACLHLTGSVGGVTADDVRRMYAALERGETPSGRPWRRSSIADLHKMLVTCLGAAERAGVIAASPMRDVKCPKVERKRVDALSSDYVDALLESLDYSDGTQRALALCAACGLRRSEAVAVEWADLQGELQVRSSKSDAGVRSVPVPHGVRMRLEAHRIDSAAISGGIRPDALTRWCARRYGNTAPRVTPHALRHAYATRLAEAGVHPRVMMELLGHSSIDVCMEIYTHVSGGLREDAVRAAFSK